MKLYGTLDSLLTYTSSEIQDYSTAAADSDLETRGSSLEGLIEEKVLSLAKILRQVEQDMVQRQHLSRHILTEITHHYCYLKTKLFELYTWALGGNRSIESRRSSLEKQLDALNQEKRREGVESWKDIAVLKKEWRVWFKQYCDVVQRARIILADRVTKK